MQTLNHNSTISNCTLTQILYGGTLELVCNKDCLFFYITEAELQLQLMIPNEYKIKGKRQSNKMNKKNQYNIKDYINSFNTQKKIAIYLSVALLLFHLLSIFIYLIERTDITILTESNIISVITSMLTISFSISEILDVYLFLFPIFFIIFNFVMLHKNKYNKLVIMIDYIFQIINPITIGFFVSAFLLVINKEYPI